MKFESSSMHVAVSSEVSHGSHMMQTDEVSYVLEKPRL